MSYLNTILILKKVKFIKLAKKMPGCFHPGLFCIKTHTTYPGHEYCFRRSASCASRMPYSYGCSWIPPSIWLELWFAELVLSTASETNFTKNKAKLIKILLLFVKKVKCFFIYKIFKQLYLNSLFLQSFQVHNGLILLV